MIKVKNFRYFLKVFGLVILLPTFLCMISLRVSATNLVNKNEREKIPKEFSKQATTKAINYTHCCKSDSELLKCLDCDCKIKYENIGCDTLKDCKKEW